MSNLAHQVQRNTESVQNPQPKTHVKRKLSRFTKGEKVLWSIAGILMLVTSIFIISNYAEMYTVNKDIQVIEQKIDQQNKKVNDLTLEKSELSEPLRIMNYAEDKLGMKFDDKNVKVVNN
ncbi:cell division protein FtsL [Pseudalkalibacillus berkeleyi]|uniref:Cell division protein FtsL n=1 Tax=Pseudalkalibacillus berkeleyi TaxID=1069813 RepID=A0ABS9GW16_9BACL|nr:cell division protein FtsL [Pseudalkalibacillus berkeleyi]MCF6137007.1 cell division protein FtsL [Pseudalkalibacillus berkeleyi]